MRIDVSGHQFTFPQECACCGAPADTVWTVSASRSRGKRVVHTTSKRWDVPYCKECAGHASLYRSAAGIALLAFVVGGVLALIVGDALGALVFALAILGSIIVFWRLRARATAQRKAACSVSGPAVNYLGWEGTVNSFDMVQPYGIAFLVANRTKVVNESYELRQYLNQVAPDTEPRDVQRPRRYER